MSWIKPVRLEGQNCCLELLTKNHCEELVEAVKDGELWKLWYTFVPSPETMQEEINYLLSLFNQGSMLPFVIIYKEKVVGMTTYLNINKAHRRLEIGSTWIKKSCQKTGVNTESKFLLLNHAFEDLKVQAVELRTHYLNQASRRAIERLGAKLDGILRNHMIMPKNGSKRDTCVYSIIDSEWPTIKVHLQATLKL